jgi:probable F420-dependent oxidoreductase
MRVTVLSPFGGAAGHGGAAIRSVEKLTGTGIWSTELRYGEPAEIADAAAELESLGYTGLWIPDVGGPLFEAVDRLLDATSTVTVATGVLNVWQQTPAEVARWWNTSPGERRDRVLLGLGVSHAPFIGERWRRPLATMNEFLDTLDANGVPADRRCLAALGPKMLELARRRSSGAHPYLVTPEHTERARAALGDAALYVEQGVVLETDPDTARRVAREMLAIYCGLPNYVNNWKRLGFTDDDVAGPSDRLIDALFAWGDRDAIDARIDAHRQAGADHVCIQVLAAPGGVSTREAWRALAPRG